MRAHMLLPNIQTDNRCLAYRAIATADIQLILIIFYLICIDIDNDIHLYSQNHGPTSKYYNYVKYA